jgi:hypothetical protein
MSASNFYHPTEIGLKYFKENNNKFYLSEDEVIKFIEIVHNCIYRFSSDTEYQNPTSDPKTQEIRKTICHNCPEYILDKDECNVCGCRVTNKVQSAIEMCPYKKWCVDEEFIKHMIERCSTDINQYLNSNPFATTIEEYSKQQNE